MVSGSTPAVAATRTVTAPSSRRWWPSARIPPAHRGRLTGGKDPPSAISSCSPTRWPVAGTSTPAPPAPDAFTTSTIPQALALKPYATATLVRRRELAAPAATPTASPSATPTPTGAVKAVSVPPTGGAPGLDGASTWALILMAAGVCVTRRARRSEGVGRSFHDGPLSSRTVRGLARLLVARPGAWRAHGGGRGHARRPLPLATCAQASTEHHAALVVEHSDGSGHGAGPVIPCVRRVHGGLDHRAATAGTQWRRSTGPADSGQAVCQVDYEPALVPPRMPDVQRALLGDVRQSGRRVMGVLECRVHRADVP